MVRTASTMLPLGTEAPAFRLTDVVSQQTFSPDSFGTKDALLVMFICRHCPYVQHIKDELARLGKDFENSALGIVAISSNDPNSHPDDAPPRLKEMAQDLDFRFPLLFDGDQEVARAYAAACTPDFFLFDKERRLVYRGQLDDSRPGNGKPVTGADLRRAIDAVLNGRPVDPNQKASLGCNIKWKGGNEPAYFVTG
ncbi:MAG: thioredoxin family protein [Acidobacteria bacterium]|nr:MAG: thioredoxin family protein [Acidobacteriota bacterium]